MKAINLYQLIDTWKSIDSYIFIKFQTYTGIGEAQSGVRESELKDIEQLTNRFKQERVAVNNLDGFYIGYSIPQISKEFDLLRFGQDFLLDIEIKSQSTEEKMEHQLKRNQYYLKFLRKEIFLYTYVINTGVLYTLENDKMKEVSFQQLIAKLDNQEVIETQDIDKLFNPTNYLISPFNSTEEFIAGNYFLTDQQEDIKNKVVKEISSHTKRYISITGAAGTGKTLLTYDIAKYAIKEGYKVLILHCAQLNKGQILLRNKYGWNIYQAKDGIRKNINDYDVVIVDETQRAYPRQYDAITKGVEASDALCIFSYDKSQCLSYDELRWNIADRINSLDSYTFKLNKKIRTNKEIATFIKCLLNSKLKAEGTLFPNVSVSFCNKHQNAKRVLECFYNKGWKVPNYTPGTYSTFRYEDYGVAEEDSTHAVIGQEYDNIVAVIDSDFYYDDKGKLQSLQGKCYSQRQMLFQILTRTRKKLHILVIDNPQVFEKCLEIIS